MFAFAITDEHRLTFDVKAPNASTYKAINELEVNEDFLRYIWRIFLFLKI